MKKIEVLYKLDEGGVKPSQGYENDYAYDMYASEGVIVPPSTFESVKIPTNLKMAFDPTKMGLKVSLRSGVASNTPLIMANSPGIIEGTYRDGIKILVRNAFLESVLVDFIFTEDGEKIKVTEVPKKILNQAKKFHTAEMKKLEYGKLTKETKDVLYNTHVPNGSIYVRKHTRIAQLHMQEKVTVDFVRVNDLPESRRGIRGLGSSGTERKGDKA